MREVLLCLLSALMLAPGHAAEPAALPSPGSELDLAVKKLRLTPGFKAELFAAEPLIQNPVSFTFDERGRAYVVETHRRRTSVYDIRNHPDWLDRDFSFRTVADRSNFFRSVLIPGATNLPAKIVVDRNGDGQFDYRDLEVESERLRRVVDENGDGRADSATTFAEDFKTTVSGVAAGVLARRGEVYFTCIPDLWVLRDLNNDGAADFRKSLAHGFGVHISFGGHDLHGLKFGPDGKLYFSVADRGLHVETEGRTLANPDSGAILRCDPDGSNLELFATGFRNPQELAFDQFGNLWTGDNNGDGGDKARWLYVVEGGEYGWHYGWQHQPKMGAWNSELLWELPTTNSAAYLIPPIAHIGHGPAGLAFYPGTGLPAQYRNNFFLCDFPGGVHSFSVEPKGAGFAVADLRQFLWNLFPVDVDFGPDGGTYVLDWIEGWEKTGKGRLFRIFEETSAQDPAVADTRALLGFGMSHRPFSDLGALLSHPDLRVRNEAQFELATRGAASSNLLAQIASNPALGIARLHAIWAFGQIARAQPLAITALYPLSADANVEVRAQAARVLGDSRFALALPQLARAAADPQPRVRYFGVLGLGKIGKLGGSEGIETVLQAAVQSLRDNQDADPFLRHAAVFALTALNDPGALEPLTEDSSPSIRMGALLALRRLQRPEIAKFLYDPSPALVTEAARAIYDAPIPAPLTQLAALAKNTALPSPALRRALHANLRLGKLENAMALADFATSAAAPELRAEAITLLGRWPEAAPRDSFLGLWRPAPERQARAASITIRSQLPALLQSDSPEIRAASVQTTARLGVSATGPQLFQIFTNLTESAPLRLEALRAIATFKDARLAPALRLAAADPDAEIRKYAGTLEAQRQPGDNSTVILRMLETGILPEKQSALDMLGNLQHPSADPVLLMWLDRAAAGKAPPELLLEILEAASKRSDPKIKQNLNRWQESRANDTNNTAAGYSEVLAGGTASNGRTLFLERQELQCVRCHKLAGAGLAGAGGEVGPDLTGIGARLTRQQLLESIVLPNNRIAPGYENLVIKMLGGETYIGLLKREDAENIYIDSPEDGPLRVPKAEIADLDLGPSAMLPDLANAMTRRELRDLVEFLASQK